MRIIQFIASLGPGGAETLVKDLSIGLKDKGHNVLVIVLDSYHNEYTEKNKIRILNKHDIKVFSLNRSPGSKSINPFFKLKKIVHSFKPNIIHIHSEISGFYCIPFIFNRHIKLVQTVHSTVLPKHVMQKFLKLPLIKKNIFKVYCSVSSSDSLSNEYGEGVVISNGIKLQKPNNIRNDLINAFNINKKATILLNVGRVTIAKNHVILPLIIEKLNKDVYKGSLYLFICGSLNENETVKKLKKSIAHMTYSNCIKLLGTRNDVINIMHSVDAYISTSIYEGLPMTGLEAMTTGVPMFMSPIKEHKNIFEGEAEVYFPTKNDVISFTNLIKEELKYVDKNTVIEQRKKFMNRYNINNTVNKYIELFIRI